MMTKPKQDLTGKRFGKLTVIKQADNHFTPSGYSVIKWDCTCDCGREHVIKSTSELNAGRTLSCGQEECHGHRKFNNYNLLGRYGIGKDDKGNEFYFDLEDYEKIKEYNWILTNEGYWKAYIPKYKRDVGNNKTIKLHNIIIDTPKSNYIVDHISHNKSDNRKSNLRLVNHSLNSINRDVISSNTSGCTGVYWRNNRKRWVANIKINGKYKIIGSFKNKEDAISARKEAENEYYGEYSYDNSMALAEQNPL